MHTLTHLHTSFCEHRREFDRLETLEFAFVFTLVIKSRTELSLEKNKTNLASGMAQKYLNSSRWQNVKTRIASLFKPKSETTTAV